MAADSRGSAEPWGHKIHGSIYVPGTQEQALLAAETVADQILVPTAEFVGVSILEVAEKPYDQGAS